MTRTQTLEKQKHFPTVKINKQKHDRSGRTHLYKHERDLCKWRRRGNATLAAVWIRNADVNNFSVFCDASNCESTSLISTHIFIFRFVGLKWWLQRPHALIMKSHQAALLQRWSVTLARLINYPLESQNKILKKKLKKKQLKRHSQNKRL